jgi:hypothetical protein
MTVAGYKRLAGKKSCVFAVLAVDLLGHHRLTRIPRRIRAEALGVWTAGLMWTRANERDGFVSLEALHEVARSKIVDELVRVGLVTRHVDDQGDHGFILHRYDLYNELKAEIDSRRLKWREAKVPEIPGGSKAEATEIPPSFRASDARVSDQHKANQRKGEGEAPPSGGRLSSRPDYTAFPIDRWCDGVRSVTGKPVLRPTGSGLNKLVAAFEAHGPKDQRELDDWAYRVGAAYAEKQAGREVVAGWCADWLGSADCPVIAPLAKAPLPPEPPPPSPEELEAGRKAGTEAIAKISSLFAPKASVR